MDRRALVAACAVILGPAIAIGTTQQAPPAKTSQAAGAVPSGDGPPPNPGITRTTVKEDAKMLVNRVHFIPGAREVPHTHPFDLIVIPLESAPMEMKIGDRAISALEKGVPQFIPRGTVHYLANMSGGPFDVVTVGIK